MTDENWVHCPDCGAAANKARRTLARCARGGERMSERIDPKYAAEKVMAPILATWFGYDAPAEEVERYTENAAVDLSWALEGAGLLVSPVEDTE